MYVESLQRLKFEVSYARYMPEYKLGRWDGKVAFFGIVVVVMSHRPDTITDILHKQGVEIVDIQDKRHPNKNRFPTY